MTKRFTHCLFLTLLGCVAIAALPVGSGAADSKDKPTPGLADADRTAALNFNLGILNESLSEHNGKPSKAARLKAQTAAWMIAAATQSGGAAPSPQMATIRNAAIKITAAINDGKLDEARDQAKNLMALKPDAAAKLPAVPLASANKGPGLAELEDVMNQFKGPRSGGLGYEDRLEEWGEKPPTPKGATQKEVVQMANQLFLVFETARSIEAPKKIKGTQRQWEKFADTAREAARDLGDAGRKGDADATAKAIKAVNKACVDCHMVFKPKEP